MSDPASFDVLLPARSTAGAVEVTYAALTLSSRTAALLCDRIGWARGASAPGAWAAHAAPIADTMFALLDNLPRYYRPPPGHRDLVLERALERLPDDGFAIAPWEEREGRVPVGAGAMAVTPFALCWRGTAYAPRETQLADEARYLEALELVELMDAARAGRPAPPSRRPPPAPVGTVETGPLALAVLRQLADGSIGLNAPEPRDLP